MKQVYIFFRCIFSSKLQCYRPGHSIVKYNGVICMHSKHLLFSALLIVLALRSAETLAQDTQKKHGVDQYQSRAKNPVAKHHHKKTKALLPEKIDLMENQTVVKNQDQRGTCAYFSTTAQIESEIKRVTKKEVNLSEEYQIRYGKGVLGHSQNGDGSFSSQNLETFEFSGVTLERDLPYQPDWFGVGLPCAGIEKKSEEAVEKGCYSHFAPTDEMQAKAIKLEGLTVEQIDVADLKTVLAAGISPIVSVPVNFHGWDDTTGNAYHSDELKKECDEKPDSCGTHSILLVGYDDNLEAVYDGKTVKGAFIFKNSWGHDWAKGGYGKFPYEMIENWGYDAAYTTLDQKFTLPEGAEVSGTVATTIEQILYAHEIDADGNLISKVSAKVSGAPNAMLYTSTFVTDEAHELFQLDGEYVRAPYYQAVGQDGSATIDNGVMKINQTTWDEVVAALTPVFLRVSVYIFSDTEAWKVLAREFIAL